MKVKDFLDFVNEAVAEGTTTLNAEVIAWDPKQDDWGMSLYLEADEDWLRIIAFKESKQ